MPATQGFVTTEAEDFRRLTKTALRQGRFNEVLTSFQNDPYAEDSESTYELVELALPLPEDDDRTSDLQVVPSLTSSSIIYEPPKNRSIQLLLSDWFIFEGLATVISAGALITLIAVLAKHDRQPQPGWSHLSLNSVIAWLTTISKACILFFVSEALGQSKWVWFAQDERPVKDIRAFDAASRGPYGALELVRTLRGKHFAVVGGLAVILAVAFEPFAQNLVQYYEGYITDANQNATVGGASYYGDYDDSFQMGAFLVSYTLRTNVYNTFFNTRPIPQYSCTSTNCTWDAVLSLDTMAHCADITEHLTQSCNDSLFEGGATNCTAHLLKSRLHAWASYYNSTEFSQALGFVVKTVDPSQAFVYTNTTTSAIQFINPEWSYPGIRWNATECTIEPIVRKFKASVRSNEYSEETIAIWSDRALVKLNQTESPVYLDLHPELAQANDTDYQWTFSPPWQKEFAQLNMPANTVFNYTLLAEKAIEKFLRIILTGHYWKNATDSGYAATAPDASLYAANEVLQGIHRDSNGWCNSRPVLEPGKFNCTIWNIAQAIGKTFRDSRDVTYGRVEVKVTHVRVQWPWIVLPVCVWALGTVALLGTIWKTRQRRAPRWKNDPLPLLFLYKDDEELKNHPERAKERPIPDLDTLKVRLHGD
ncbi:hypothetical protein BJY04DRAFT_216249 [Aspergillus karnatakaensis]|uniref:DUF3176 domain-containing protein n=1 Tax=Aspergillus karnatakaensis TaxID=1810916 RepID=UPI003CCE2565